jgi:hypothetical protein
MQIIFDLTCYGLHNEVVSTTEFADYEKALVYLKENKFTKAVIQCTQVGMTTC